MPLARQSRALLEDWFESLCAAAQPSIRARLASGDDEAFSAALWELCLYRLFTRQGYEVLCEPPLPNSDKLIDFLVRRGEEAFYVEATIARRSRAEQGADARRHRVYAAINDAVRSRDFMLGIEIESAGSRDLPNVAALCKRLRVWLDSLDPDAVGAEYLATDGQFPELTWEDQGWRITFQALPVKPEARKSESRDILGMFMDETGGAIDDETPLTNALRGKTPNRYGELDHPYVIAVCEYPWSHGDDAWHRKNVLFGREGVRFGDGVEPEWTRIGGGFWRSGSGGPVNTRVSAILLATHLTPWTVDTLRLEWWSHPFAGQPIPASAVPEGVASHSMVVTDGRGELAVQEPAQPPATLL